MGRDAMYKDKSFWRFGMTPMALFEAHEDLKLGAYMPVIEVVEDDVVRYQKVLQPELEELEWECWVLSQQDLTELRRRLAEDQLPLDYSDFVAAVLDAVDDDDPVYILGDFP